MMSGASARTAASPKPMPLDHPGAEVLDEHVGAGDQPLQRLEPVGVFRSSAIERLLRLLLRNEAEKPPRRLAAARV